MNSPLALPLLALAVATGAAQAANCPRGQIYRVSKHVCVDHDEAVKLGIAHGPARNADKTKPAPDAAAQEPEAPQQPAAAQQQAAPETPAVAAPAEEPAPAAAALAPEAAPEAPSVKSVRTVRIIPPRPGAPVPPLQAAQPGPAKVEATAANPSSPFGALDPGGVPMSQPK